MVKILNVLSYRFCHNILSGFCCSIISAHRSLIPVHWVSFPFFLFQPRQISSYSMCQSFFNPSTTAAYWEMGPCTFNTREKDWLPLFRYFLCLLQQLCFSVALLLPSFVPEFSGASSRPTSYSFYPYFYIFSKLMFNICNSHLNLW